MAEINKTIFLHGEFGVEITSENVIPQIDAAIKDGVNVITFDISSVGGSVKVGREIMGAIERAKLSGIKIATQCLSFAYSMGANVFLMGTKGMRRMSEHAEIMLHPVMGAAEGNAKKMMEVVTQLQEMSDNLLEYAVKGNEANADAIKSSFENAEMIGAARAISLGLADGYVEKLKAVAYLDTKNIDMKKENIDEAKGLLDMLKEGIKNLFKQDVKNAFTQAGDTTFYYEGTLAVDTMVFTDEAMTTPTPDGVYGDYTVAGGKVTAIAAEPTDLEKANAKIAELQAVIDAKDAETKAVKDAMEAKEADAKAKFDAMAANIAKLETIVIGEEGRHREEGNDKPKLTAHSRMIEIQNKIDKQKINN